MKQKIVIEKKIDPQIAWQKQVIREEFREVLAERAAVNASAGTASRSHRKAL